MNGVSMPDLDGCPECGSENLWGVENTKQGVSINLDGQGGVKTISKDNLIETSYSSLGCRSCDAMLVEDGDVVHDEVDA